MPASNWHAVKSACKKATLANAGEMIVNGNVIADMQSELETVKQRLRPWKRSCRVCEMA
jgi:hypothetical protein